VWWAPAVVHERLRGLVHDARALPGTGAALFGFIERLVLDAAAKQDLVDALAGAGVDVKTTVAATAAELRGEIDRLLLRAQEAGEVRADIAIADLMALLSGLLFALHSRSNERADPRRALAVLCDGLRTN
jgi:hypothetical protein